MIHVYNSNNTDFSKNGDMTIQPIKAVLTNKGINTIPFIELDLPFDEFGRWGYVVNDSIIRCHTPWDKASDSKGQLFRVYETEKETDIYKVYARHISADLMTTITKDFSNNDITIVATGQTNGQGAITKLLANTQFTGHSNIAKTDSVRWERKTITEALLSDDENSFVTRWNGELFVNNFNVYMNTRVGGDYGVKISYGKNLDSITENVNKDGVITRIIPTGYNGIRLTGSTPWVDSINISKYPKPLEKPVEFNNVKVKEKPEDEDGFATIELARAELIRLSNLMFTQQHVDTPIVNIKTSMVDISQTLEYKTMGYSGLEDVNLGDTVICSHYKIGIETEARCIGYTWDILTEKMINIEIGDVTKNFFDKQADMSNTVAKILDGNTVKADKIAGIINALQTKFIAQRSIAQPQEIRAILFEDLDNTSPSYGASCIGSMGLEIASKRTTDDKDWDWNTFITGGEVYADWLVGKLKTVLIEALDGSISINLNNGEFRIGSTDGTDTVTHTNHNSIWRHSIDGYTEANANGFFRNGRPYHTLITAGYCITGGSAGAVPATAVVQLPNEWKGRNFQVFASMVDTQGGISNEWVKRVQLNVSWVDTVNARFGITGSWTSISPTDENNKELKSMYVAIGG